MLAQHQKECEINGKYVEAEMAKNRIAELKASKKNKSIEELAMR
jgi:predicted RecB family endonuclease